MRIVINGITYLYVDFLLQPLSRSWLQMPIGFSWSNKVDSLLSLSTAFSATKNRYNLSRKFVKRHYTKRQYIAKITFIVSMNGTRDTLFIRLFSLVGKDVEERIGGYLGVPRDAS